EFSVARTPQKNGVAKRKNMTLIEATRTMLANSLLPIVFWAEAINTACYVLNRVLVTKPHNKIPYELIIGRPPSISFMRPFGCPVTILNTRPLGKFNRKTEEGFLVGYKSSDETYKNDTANDAAGETHVQKPASENEQALKNVLDKMMDQEKEASEQSDAVRKDFEVQCNRELLQGKATKASNDPLMPDLEDTAEVQNTMGAEADFNNMEPSIVASPIPTTRVHSIHPKDQQEPTKITQALDDESWVEAMQEELLQFKIHKVWTLVGQPYSKKAIGIKWVYRNKKDKRGIVVRNKVRLVAQGYKQEEGINYDEVFAHIARIEAIRLFLAYASFMNFLVY
ncbi:retrovirus-related pol polyprotein from transposon TNT 1-94, partial [Tanacetum coccineum]